MNDSPVSVVIPARNAGSKIAEVLRALFEQQVDRPLDVVVVDDGSNDNTAAIANQFPCRVVTSPAGTQGPAAARNLGAEESLGDPIVFLDADCIPQPGWLHAIMQAHADGHAVVGGAIDMPRGLPFTARADYFCGFYLVHGQCPRGLVSHHPPPNLSFRRNAFFASGGFSEAWPLYYTNEEREPLARLRAMGQAVLFEPGAAVQHHNRPGLVSMLRRHYRWGFTSIESKHLTRSARMSWLYRWPLVTALSVPLLAVGHSVLIVGLWIRYGRLEIIAHIPLVLISRIWYAAGMLAGVADWYKRRLTHTQAGKHWRSP
ncbi:MAG: glycosyltransferase [Woeseia sp.]|nr:glycosyltransferase [Woeseia sp.]